MNNDIPIQIFGTLTFCSKFNANQVLRNGARVILSNPYFFNGAISVYLLIPEKELYFEIGHEYEISIVLPFPSVLLDTLVKNSVFMVGNGVYTHGTFCYKKTLGIWEDEIPFID